MAGFVVVADGLLFAANASGKTYISLYQHRGNGNRTHKSMWINTFLPGNEHGLFCNADTGVWQDDAGHFWAVHNGGNTTLGEQGEILCKFPANQNPGVPWHGYPVSTTDGRAGDCPPDDFVEQWREAGVVDRVMAKRIQKRKV